MHSTAKVQQLLLDLQTTDSKIRSIRSEAENLTETAQLKHLIENRRRLLVERARAKRTVSQQKGALADLDPQISKLTADLATLEKNLAGETRAKVAEALLRQKAADTERLSRLDRQRDEREKALAEAQKAENILSQDDERLEQVGLDIKQRRDDKIDHLRRRMAVQRDRRQLCVDNLPPEVLDLYVRFAREAAGPVVVRYIEGSLERTSGIELSTSQLSDIAAARPGDILPFEDTGIIVVRI